MNADGLFYHCGRYDMVFSTTQPLLNRKLNVKWFPAWGFSATRTGKRTSAKVINFGTLLFHDAEVNISIELGDEVTAVPNIDCPQQKGRDINVLAEH